MFTLLVSAAIWLLIPINISKFQLEKIDQKVLPGFNKIFYHDLNNNGYSDMMITNFKYQRPSVVINNHQQQVVTQWTLEGDWLKKGMQLMFGDHDQNGFAEIFAFTIRDDSVFINGFEPYQNGGVDFREQFVDLAHSYRGEQDCNFVPGKLTDLNQDGYQEVVFVINAGFTEQPRNVYAWDIKNQTLLKSPKSGAFITAIRFANLDHDDAEEILVDNYAPNNISDVAFPYRDNQAWIMALDNSFEFLFAPVPYQYRYSTAITWPYLQQDSLFLIAAFDHYGKTPADPELLKLDARGQVAARKTIPRIDGKNNLVVGGNNRDQILKVHREGTTWEIGPSLEIEETESFSPTTERVFFRDLDRDGDPEAIGLNHHARKLIVSSEEINHLVTADLVFGESPDFYLNHKTGPGENQQFALQIGDVHHLFEYQFNPWYYLKFLSLVPLYLLVLGLMTLIDNKKAKSNLPGVLEKLTNGAPPLPDKIRINTRNGFILIKLEEILYCKADGNYTAFYLSNNGPEIATRNLGSIEALLPSPPFQRLSRSLIINTGYLYKVDRKRKQCVLNYHGKRHEIPVTDKILKKLAG